MLGKKRYENIFHPDEHTNKLETQCYDNIIAHHTLKLCLEDHEVAEICMDKKVDDHTPIRAQFEVPKTYNQ